MQWTHKDDVDVLGEVMLRLVETDAKLRDSTGMVASFTEVTREGEEKHWKIVRFAYDGRELALVRDEDEQKDDFQPVERGGLMDVGVFLNHYVLQNPCIRGMLEDVDHEEIVQATKQNMLAQCISSMVISVTLMEGGQERLSVHQVLTHAERGDFKAVPEGGAEIDVRGIYNYAQAFIQAHEERGIPVSRRNLL